eukprot:SAG11_NODE_1311_length_5234_cov_4.354820_2_plen_154_part_00
MAPAVAVAPASQFDFLRGGDFERLEERERERLRERERERRRCFLCLCDLCLRDLCFLCFLVLAASLRSDSPRPADSIPSRLYGQIIIARPSSVLPKACDSRNIECGIENQQSSVFSGVAMGSVRANLIDSRIAVRISAKTAAATIKIKECLQI